MYPNLYYAFDDLFGIKLEGLRWINSFGFFVAISFMLCAWLLNKELKRKEKQGLLTFKEEKIWIGKPASLFELCWNGLLGFIVGYKIIGVMAAGLSGTASSPQEYILSNKGNVFGGTALALLLAGLRWWEKRKKQLPKPEQRVVRIWPHDRIGDFVLVAALFGFLGAKVFNSLENWDQFVKDPVKELASFSGLTFYGGLICAGVAIYYLTQKKKISFIPFLDALVAPMMLAYAVGRIGCQISGDGDWGIENVYPKPLSWLPNWMWGYQYPHNVISEGIPISGCVGQQYCNQLPVPVFPTPFYETVICLMLFFILWAMRKKIRKAGVIAGIYFIMNGLERFFIEKIRVNTQYHFWGINPTQAEIISTLLVALGIFMVIYFTKKLPQKELKA